MPRWAEPLCEHLASYIFDEKVTDRLRNKGKPGYTRLGHAIHLMRGLSSAQRASNYSTESWKVPFVICEHIVRFGAREQTQDVHASAHFSTYWVHFRTKFGEQGRWCTSGPVIRTLHFPISYPCLRLWNPSYSQCVDSFKVNITKTPG